MQEINLGSYKTYMEIKQKAQEHWKKYPPHSDWRDFCENCTGNYIFQSKNCHECFEVSGAQDSKYLVMIKEGPVRDSYDYNDLGSNALRVYESGVVGEKVTDVRFSHESGFNLLNIDYSKLQTGGSDCFGCVSLKKGKYLILNKQYTKEEYKKLIPKIKQHMMEMLYVDKKGNIYKYGEFFPMEFSPHAYNHTFAHSFSPLDKQEILSQGLNYKSEEKKKYKIEIKAEDLPDNIKEVSNSLINKIINCLYCGRGFKIIQLEIDFLRRMNLPLPRICPFCRINKKTEKWVKKINLFEKNCDECNKLFKTFYTKEEAPIVWCLDCYKKEIF